MHRKLQRQLDFRSVRNYRKTILEKLLDTINGADHSKFLEDKLGKEGNYMSKKNDHRRNLMTVEKLLSRIAKFAKNPEQRLKEAQSFIKSTFPQVHGMATTERSSPRFVVHVLMDCFDEQMDCNHQKYRKEQNIGLHDVISPAATARLTVKETYERGWHSDQGEGRRCLLPVLQIRRLPPSYLEQPCPDAPPGYPGVWMTGLLLCPHEGRLP